jgi:hypothetical protein
MGYGSDGSIHIDTKLDVDGLKPQLATMTKSISASFASIRDVMQGPVQAGKMVIQAFQAVAAEASRLENAWAEAEEAGAVLDSTIKATGASSWTSAKAIQDMASEFQDMTKYEGDAIVAMSNVLLGFKNIKGDNFKEASLQILNMATVMKMDLTSAAQMMGKALDNLDWEALSRQGFKFTQAQKDAGNAMKAAGNLAGAQKIILDELATTYGGAAEAAGNTGTAIKVKLANAVGDLNEEMGRSITNMLTPFRKQWLEIAKAVGAAARAQNDFNESMNRIANGGATTEDRLVDLNYQLKQLEANLGSAGATGGYFEGSASGIQESINAIKSEIDLVKALDSAKKSAEASIAAGDAEKKKRADIDARNAEIALKRLAIEKAYSEAVAKNADSVSLGTMSSEDADSDNLSNLIKEREALIALQKEYGLTFGSPTVAKIDEVTQAIKDSLATDESRKAFEELILDQAEYAKRLREASDAEIAGVNKYVDGLEQIKTAYGGLDPWDELHGEAFNALIKEAEDYIAAVEKIADAQGVTFAEAQALYEKQNETVPTMLDNMKASWDSYFESIKKDAEDWADVMSSIGSFVGDSIVGAFEELGKAIVTGTTDWDNWGIAALKSFAGVLKSLAEQLAALAIVHALMGDWIGAAAAVAGGIAAGIASGAVSAYADSLQDAADVASESTKKEKAFATALENANSELADNKKLFASASKAAAAYDSVLTGIVDTVSDFYAGLQDIGADIAGILIDSLVEGMDGDDFLYAMEEYITKSVVQAAVFTDTFTSTLGSIGASLGAEIAKGAGASSSTISALRSQLASLYQTATASALAASNIVSSAFSSYAVGTLGLPSDGPIFAHAGEAVIPAGLMSEAMTAGLTIAPTASLMSGMSNISLSQSFQLVVDGKAMSAVVYKYQDELAGAAYGT